MAKKSKYLFKIDPKGKDLKAKHIVNAVTKDIDKGILKSNDVLPSIEDAADVFGVAKETVEKAYKKLAQEGHIVFNQKKGYCVSDKTDNKLRVLLVFNRLGSFKKIVYDSFVESTADKVNADLQIHHYDPKLLRDILKKNSGKYDYYVVMPHFFHEAQKQDYIDTLKLVPSNQLIILDKAIPDFDGFTSGVYQDFENDIFYALTSLNDTLRKYNSISLVLEEPHNHPLEIITGIEKYCQGNAKRFGQINRIDSTELQAGTVYIVTSDSDLAALLKKVKDSEFEMGNEVGIISFNETVLKEILDITVITTDFVQMGKSLADLVLNQAKGNIKNLFQTIIRSSV